MSVSLYDAFTAKLHLYIDRVIHASTGLAVVFAGIGFDHWVMIFPALISAIVAVLALIFKKIDTNKRFKIYMSEEAARTKAIVEYLENSKTDSAAAKVIMANKAEKALHEGEKIQPHET